MKEICKECEYARDKFGKSCYCVKLGIIIGYSKQECRQFERAGEREQVQEPKDVH